jgi:hypothetical protein
MPFEPDSYANLQVALSPRNRPQKTNYITRIDFNTNPLFKLLFHNSCDCFRPASLSKPVQPLPLVSATVPKKPLYQRSPKKKQQSLEWLLLGWHWYRISNCVQCFMCQESIVETSNEIAIWRVATLVQYTHCNRGATLGRSSQCG